MDSVEVRIGCVKISPFVNFCKNITQLELASAFRDITFPGIDVEVMKEMILYTFDLELQNVTVSMRTFQEFGKPFYNSTGIIASLMKNEIDIALPVMLLTSQRWQVLDFVMPVVNYEPQTYIINPMESILKPPSLAEVFDQLTWLVSFLMLLITSLSVAGVTQFTAIMERRNRHILRYAARQRYEMISRPKVIQVTELKPYFLWPPTSRGSVHKRMSVFDAMFGIAFQKRARAKWMILQNRVLITIWSFGSIVGLCLFSGIYVRGLSPELRALPFDNVVDLGELLKRKTYTLTISQGIMETWLQPNSNFKIWEPIRESLAFQKPIITSFRNESLSLIARNHGYVYPMLELEGIIFRKDHPGILQTSDKKFPYERMMSFGIIKGLSYQNRLRDCFHILKETGIYDAIRRKYSPNIESQFELSKVRYATMNSLDFLAILESLWLLFYAAIISCVLCAMEIFHNWYYSRKEN